MAVSTGKRRLKTYNADSRNANRLGAVSALPTVVLAIVSILLASLMFGCDPITKYRVLSFFFDGVPVPPGLAEDEPEEVTGPWGMKLDPNDPAAQKYLAGRAGTRRPQDSSKPEHVYYHAPYYNRNCDPCHYAKGSFQAVVAEDICRKCHDSYYDLREDDWVHGPVALGKCQMCHEPHEASHEALLKDPMPDLCFSCHDAKQTLGGIHHVEALSLGCPTCHDPHSAGNRLLLIDSMSLARRKKKAKMLPSAHIVWTKDSGVCDRCHLRERSNQLADDIDSVCVSCHDDLSPTDSDSELHSPVREGKCTTCHTPHKSSRPKLIKPAGEKNCMGCHKTEQFQTDSHPPITRADCLLCHKGHSSQLKHLLKPPTVLKTPTTAPSSQPTTAPIALSVDESIGGGR